MAINLKGSDTSTYSDGATFASNVQVGGTDASSTEPGGYIYSTRYINDSNRGSAALNGQALDGDLASLIVIDRSAAAVETVTIKPDGSASFAGSSFNIGDYTFDSSTTSGAEFDSGSLTLQRPGSVGATSRSIAGRWGADIKWEIDVDGGATFAGDIVTGNFNSGLTTTSGIELGVGGACSVQRTAAASSTSLVWRGLQGATVSSSITTSGNATFTGNVTAANVSDIKFKENITDAKPQLSDVVALGSSLKNWDWKEEAPLNDELKSRRFLGLIAQEAEETCPGITYDVSRTRSEELTPETTDEDGEVIPATYEEIDDPYKAINHDILVMKLLGAVAEQNARIEALEAQLTQLTGGAN